MICGCGGEIVVLACAQGQFMGRGRLARHSWHWHLANPVRFRCHLRRTTALAGSQCHEWMFKNERLLRGRRALNLLANFVIAMICSRGGEIVGGAHEHEQFAPVFCFGAEANAVEHARAFVQDAAQFHHALKRELLFVSNILMQFALSVHGRLNRFRRAPIVNPPDAIHPLACFRDDCGLKFRDFLPAANCRLANTAILGDRGQRLASGQKRHGMSLASIELREHGRAPSGVYKKPPHRECTLY